MANPSLKNTIPIPPPLHSVLPPCRVEEPGPPKTEPLPIDELRLKLLYEGYGILENPFGMTPDPRYLYQSRTHTEASSSLVIGIECEVGFQALIAAPGMGKTTILLNILEQFRKVALTAFLFQAYGDSCDFLRCLISELGGEADGLDMVRLQDTINHLLVRERQAGRLTVVIIDEAQSLAPSVLETVRLLSNFETTTDKLVQIILAGQPQLARRLASSQVAQLSQRISILTTLAPLDLKDTEKYIEHRLKIAGYQGEPLFTSGAVKLIWKRSGGIPREINKLCFSALLLARAVKLTQVDSQILREVVRDLDLDPIRFSTAATLRDMRAIESANGLQLGSGPADSPQPKIDQAAVPAPKTESDSTSIQTIHLKKVEDQVVAPPAGANRNKENTIPAEAGAKEQVVRSLRNRADMVAISLGKEEEQIIVPGPMAQSDEVTSIGATLAGVPSRETETDDNSMDRPHLTLQMPDRRAANQVATRLDSTRLFRWVTALATIGILSSSILMISSLVRRNSGLHSSSRTEVLHKPMKAGVPMGVQGLTDKHDPTQSLGQEAVGGDQYASSPFSTPQPHRRIVRSMVRRTPESSARETVVGESPALGMANDKSSGKLPSVDKAPNAGNEADSVFGRILSTVPASDVGSRTRLTANIVPPQLIHRVEPIYTPVPLEPPIPVSVVLQFIVDKHGKVRDVRFISGPPTLARAAIDAVEHWRYRPSYLNGLPLEWEMLATVKFSSR